jgi:hypothetical protein
MAVREVYQNVYTKELTFDYDADNCIAIGTTDGELADFVKWHQEQIAMVIKTSEDENWHKHKNNASAVAAFQHRAQIYAAMVADVTLQSTSRIQLYSAEQGARIITALRRDIQPNELNLYFSSEFNPCSAQPTDYSLRFASSQSIDTLLIKAGSIHQLAQVNHYILSCQFIGGNVDLWSKITPL